MSILKSVIVLVAFTAFVSIMPKPLSVKELEKGVKETCGSVCNPVEPRPTTK
jgi:hypothetical protein